MSEESEKKDPGSEPLKNKRHEMFCHEYVKDFNGARSYKALIGDDGMTTEVASASSTRLLKMVNISRRVEWLKNSMANDARVSRLQFLDQLGYQTMFDPAEILNWDGERLIIKSFDEIPVEARRMIQSVKERKDYDDKEWVGTSIEIRFYSKEKFMDLYAKHLGVCADSVNITHNVRSIEEVVRGWESDTDERQDKDQGN